MKLFRHLLPVCLLLLGQAAAVASGDASGNADVPGIHAIGNGELCVYGRGADILQIFGPPYSSPSLLTLSLCDGLQVASEREAGSSVWNHRLRDGHGVAGRHTDFVADGSPVFVRLFRQKRPVRYRLGVELEERYRPFEESLSCAEDGLPVSWTDARSVFRVDLRAGVPFYSTYRSPSGYCYRLVTTGTVRLERSGENGRELTLTASPGEGALYVIAARSREELDRETARVASVSGLALLKTASRSASRPNVTVSALSGERRREFLQAVDDAAALIRSQQSSEGSVLAGIIYHMGYVRDQYGVSRALLALGEWERARMILDFYWRVWQRSGLIHNAQAIGYPGIFHRHENDETEITGYLVVQAFDYYRKTRDTAFLREIMPMLEWATEAQQRNLIDGMLPFNGDETYIAGGVVPRQVMYHGSAEATLLFVEGSRRLIRFVREQGLWSAARIGALERDADECSERFRDNFCRDGHLYVNNPRRERKVAYPPTRPGVCLYPGHFDYFPETYHFKGCLYFCKDCMTKDHAAVELPEPELFSIPSANLFPIYIGSELFSESEKRAFLDDVIALYERTGKISGQDRILGYDFGMFLYALCETGHPLRDEVYDRMMSLRDGAGAWVEYYVDGRPSGCGCRPWESGINIEAAIRYAR